jgi:hypothetical protein
MIDDPYLSLTRTQRAELIDEVARHRNLAPAILEKDYWVCRTLDAVFSLPEIGEHLVFKGGTSLSKVFGLIERFSEDVDLSFHRDYLGFGDADHDPEAASSNKKQRQRIDDLQAACAERIRQTLLPALGEKFESILGNNGDWSLDLDPEDPQTIHFFFPQAGTAALPYIKPAVRIELGARSDHWPKESRTILSYLGETLDQPLLGKATIDVLAAERTFWEKATLLHAECHRPADKAMPARYARHYHDLARMAANPVADRALTDTGLRKRVVEHKTIYFRSASANYDLAIPGSFRLVPDASRLAELQKDHDSMAQMFFQPPPPLEEILETLRALEVRINSQPV